MADLLHENRQQSLNICKQPKENTEKPNSESDSDSMADCRARKRYSNYIPPGQTYLFRIIDNRRKTNMIIKNTMLYSTEAFNKYADIFEKNGSIPSHIELAEASVGNAYEVRFDGEAVGIVLEDMDEIPEDYKIVITGVDRKAHTFTAEMKLPDSECEPGKAGDMQSIFTEAIIKKAAKVKKMSPESLSDRIRIMWNNDVPVSMIKAVVKAMPESPDESAPYAEYVNSHAFAGKCRSEMTFMIACGLLGQPVLLEAPKSAGKNVLTENFAYVMGEKCYRTNLDAQSTAEDFFGEKSTDDSAAKILEENPSYAENHLILTNEHLYNLCRIKDFREVLDGATKYETLRSQMQSVRIRLQKAPASLWADDDQGTLCIDEINAANPNLLIRLLNPLIDGDRLFSNPSCGIYKHLSLSHHVVGTMNKDYDGTFDLNEAVLSRFNVMKLKAPKDISASITMKFGNRSIKPAKPERSKSLKKLIKGGKLNKGQIAQVNKLHQAFISAVESGKVTDKVMNIRGIERALALACAFPDVFRFRDLLEFTVFNGCEDDEIHILRTITNDIVDF
jgi:MoxR-like ATPase